VPDVLLIGTKVWGALTPEHQRWLQEAADESAIHQAQLWKQDTEEAMRLFRESGVEIIIPDKSAFADKVRSMHDMFRDTEPALHELVRRIRIAGESP
jgi:TRAP-type C4-dicarboxylate transport system substrate-binding protein